MKCLGNSKIDGRSIAWAQQEYEFFVGHIFCEGNFCTNRLAFYGFSINKIYWQNDIPPFIRAEYKRNRMGLPSFICLQNFWVLIFVSLGLLFVLLILTKFSVVLLLHVGFIKKKDSNTQYANINNTMKAFHHYIFTVVEITMKSNWYMKI